MDARMVTMTAKPGHAEQLAEFWDDDVVAEITGCPGNRGFVLLLDADGSRVHGLSLWDTADDATVARGTFARHMAAVSQHLATDPEARPAHVVAAAGAVLTH